MNKIITTGLIGVTSVAALAYVITHEESPSIDEFLASHWEYPLKPQGTPPGTFSQLEASLSPESCAQCHTQQYAQWKESLHSRTMGPGILWQLQLMSPDASRSCLRCHAPLTEQFVLLAQDQGWTASKLTPPDYVPVNLHHKGLVCAACHVREHERFGPPAGKNALEGTAHGGFTAHRAFTDSRFCATCHQFPEDGARLSGKLREDTYNQWRQSTYGKEGKSCQSCHMPDRKHAWKGIHDPVMTRSALSVDLSSQLDSEGRYNISARVTNSGAGHHFPTYLVPDVQLVLEYLSPEGDTIELNRYTAAWRGNLTLTEELFDQRIPAGETISIDGKLNQSDPTGKVRLRVSVTPRYQYIVTFEDYFKRKVNDLKPQTSQLLQLAIQEARSANYEFIAAETELGSPARD